MSALDTYEHHLFDGNPTHELLPVEDDGQIVAFEMFLMDADYDPIRVTFDCDGIAEIDTSEFDYVSLSGAQLAFLAKMAAKAKRKFETLVKT